MTHLLVDLGWVDSLGCSTGRWAVLQLRCCPIKTVEHTKSKSTQPRSARRWVTLYSASIKNVNISARRPRLWPSLPLRPVGREPHRAPGARALCPPQLCRAARPRPPRKPLELHLLTQAAQGRHCLVECMTCTGRPIRSASTFC